MSIVPAADGTATDAEVRSHGPRGPHYHPCCPDGPAGGDPSSAAARLDAARDCLDRFLRDYGDRAGPEWVIAAELAREVRGLLDGAP